MYIQVKKRIIQTSSFWDVLHHANPVFWVLPWLSRTQSVYQTFSSPSCYSVSSQYLWNQLLQLPLRSEIMSLSLWIWFKHLTKNHFGLLTSSQMTRFHIFYYQNYGFNWLMMSIEGALQQTWDSRVCSGGKLGSLHQ